MNQQPTSLESRVRFLLDRFENRSRLGVDIVQEIEVGYRELLGFDRGKERVDVLLVESDPVVKQLLQAHLYQALTLITYCGGHVNIDSTGELTSPPGIKGKNYDLYFLGPTLRFKGTNVNSVDVEGDLRAYLPKGTVGFYHQLEKIIRIPDINKLLPITVVVSSAKEYEEYRDIISDYLESLTLHEVLKEFDPELSRWGDQPVFRVVAKPSKRDLADSLDSRAGDKYGRFRADVLVFNLMCTQSSLMDPSQLPLIKRYMEVYPQAVVRATVSEPQLSAFQGLPHQLMIRGDTDPLVLAKIREMYAELGGRTLSGSDLLVLDVLRPDTTSLPNPVSLPTIPDMGLSIVREFYHAYTVSLASHFFIGPAFTQLLRNRGYLPSHPDRSDSNPNVENISMPFDAYHAGVSFLPLLDSNFLAGNWNSHQNQSTVRYTSRCFNRFLELVDIGQKGEKPAIVFHDEGCETGIIEDIDPNRPYGITEPRTIWKVCPHRDAWQLYADWKMADGKKWLPDFNMPIIRVPVPLNSVDSLVVEQAIIGPTVCDILGKAKKSQDEGNRDYSDLRAAIYDVEFDRLLFYITNFREFAQPPWEDKLRNFPPTEAEVGSVIELYVNNLIESISYPSKVTDVKLPESGLREIGAILRGYSWGSFITPSTLRRNLAATFRNSIAFTGYVNIGLPKFELLVSEGSQISRRRLKEILYRVDQTSKLAFMLEDAWEMLDFSVGALTEGQKQDRITRLIGHEDFRGLPLEQGSLPIRLYRNMRETYLFLTKYGPRVRAKADNGLIAGEEAARKLDDYTGVVHHHNELAIKTCIALGESHPLYALLPYLQKIDSFTQIDYGGSKS